MKRLGAPLSRLATAIAWLYLVAALAAFGLGSALEDRFSALATLTSLRFYWLAPSLLLPLVALAASRRRLFVWGLGLAAIFIWLFGGLWLPRHRVANPARPTLRVASYNVLVINQNLQGVIETIRATDADAIGFQELGPGIAESLRTQLIGEYPFQITDVENGVISRYPITRTHRTLPGTWGPDSPPQVYRMDVQGWTVTLINTHQFAPITFDLSYAVPWVLRMRRQQAEVVAAFARNELSQDRPVIMTTDLNATDQNGVYRIINGVLRDAWREAGRGLGLTWRYQHRLGVTGSPTWLARIDHVFFSDDWMAIDARVGPWDKRSDHRPVVATLQLRVAR